jgi:predicted transcriptional regulator
MLDINEQAVIDFLKTHVGISSKEIHNELSSSVSYATIKRILSKLVSQNFVIIQGQRKATKYSISKTY